MSEAFAMRNYLLSQHISEEQIINEDQSKTAFENMLYSKAKIGKDWGDTKNQPIILFSTSHYDVLRGAIYAKKAQMKAEGIGAQWHYISCLLL